MQKGAQRCAPENWNKDRKSMSDNENFEYSIDNIKIKYHTLKILYIQQEKSLYQRQYNT